MKIGALIFLYLFTFSGIADEIYYAFPKGVNNDGMHFNFENARSFVGLGKIPWDEMLDTEKSVKLIICYEHNEPLLIDKRFDGTLLTISGDCFDNRGVIKVFNNVALKLLRDNVRVENIDLSSTNGIAMLVGSSNIYVTAAKLSHSQVGMVISSRGIRKVIENVVISHNIIANNAVVGLKLDENEIGRQYKSVTISQNEIKNNGNHGIRIWFRAKATKSSNVTDLRISSNRVRNNKGDGIVVVHQGVNEINPYPALFDIKITDNYVENNTGGVAMRGVASSERFVSSRIAGNTIRYNNGVTGGVNIFWSQGVVIEDNKICCTKTNRIDGNGILVDHGNKGISIKNNIIDRSYGNIKMNSGVGIMVLDNEDVVVEENQITDNWVGVYLGGRVPSKNIVFRKNRISGSISNSVYLDRDYDVTRVLFKDNDFD